MKKGKSNQVGHIGLGNKKGNHLKDNNPYIKKKKRITEM